MLQRKYLNIHLNEHRVDTEMWEGEQLVKSGRYLIAKTLLDDGVATVDPLGPENQLIFSAGPFAGTNFSNANRTSVGCKSPLTGGIKEANGGGTFGYALGRIETCGLTLHGQSDKWVVIHLQADGGVSFDDATPYLGKKNFEAAEMLKDKYGKKIAIGMIGAVGEYEGLLAGIAFTDQDGRPSRLAARGGVGAVMGNKKVKAIVIDVAKMPELHERKKTMANVRDYAKKLQDNPVITGFFQKVGTMGMADYTNTIGGIPVNNFTAGTQTTEDGIFKMGGNFITELNNARGGQQTHACMPGCIIQCSNVYVDADGNEITSPVEYETLALLGTNCGLEHPDDLARMNQHCNELGIDTIETGAMIAVLMDAGLAKFGDAAFMDNVFEQLLTGTDDGKIWSQGTARVGEHYNVHRVPVIKKQAISAYDPRVIEVTGISMMTTAQGADHTAGNVPRFKSKDKDLPDLMKASLEAQIACAATDSLGICIFGRVVTNPNVEFFAESINDAVGTTLEPPFFYKMGRETLDYEFQFNKAAGFTDADDELPKFFYDEPINEGNDLARFHGADVHNIFDGMDKVGAEDVPAEYANDNVY